MKTNGELSSIAKETIKDYKGTLALSFLIYILINFVCSFIPVVSFFSNFISSALVLGMLSQAFNLSIGNSITISDMFIDFKTILRYFLSSLIIGLVLVVWSIALLFLYVLIDKNGTPIVNFIVLMICMVSIIALCIFSIMLSQISFILIDDKNISAMGAIKHSIELTKNNKMKIFLFELYFIPLFLLMAICLGIPSFWIMPHYYASRAQLYLELKEQYNSVDEIA